MPINPNQVFRALAATNAINIIPNQYGLISQSGIGRIQGISSTVLEVMQIDGVLHLLSFQERGSPAQTNARDTRKKVYFPSLHIPDQDNVSGQDIQDVVDYTTGERMTTLTEQRMRAYERIRTRMDITREKMLVDAWLKGIVKDVDNSEVLNMFTKFGLTQKTVDFVLGTAATDIRAKCHEVKRYIRDNLKGEVMNGVRVYCSESFYDSLINHANVEKYYVNYAAAQTLAQNNGSVPFMFAGLEFVPYEGNASDVAGNTIDFITDDDGHAIPLGTRDTFNLFYAPPVLNSLNMANTVGVPFYAMEKMNDTQSMVNIYAETNPLPLVKRPQLLVKVFTSN